MEMGAEAEGEGGDCIRLEDGSGVGAVGSNKTNDADAGGSSGSTGTSNASASWYQLPLPLSGLLRCAINDGAGTSVVTDSVAEAVATLCRNAFQALDAMFFQAPAKLRNRPSFRHRLCLRVHLDTAKSTLSVTDLGCGMTRSDLINVFGVGSRLSHRAIQAASLLLQPQRNKDLQGSMQAPCTADDIGGFYAAFVALGTHVTIGTKAKFDDYYEFQIGPHTNNSNFNSNACTSNTSNDKESTQYSHFHIHRPLQEGTRPTIHNGYSQFHNVRGDCGTCVTITLNSKAIAAGVLNQAILKPLLISIFEQSQYTFAFSTDQDAMDIVTASQLEDEECKNDDDNNSDNETDFGDYDMDIAEDAGGRQQQQQQQVHNKYLQMVSSTIKNTTSTNNNNINITGSYNSVMERSKYIPLRLSLSERKLLRLVEAAMHCSDYTTNVDAEFKSITRRIHAQLQNISAVLRGMVIACDYEAGQQLLEPHHQQQQQDHNNTSTNYSDFDKFFRQMFEIARRHKIMNPEKMRTEYGKLIYLLQDTVSPTIRANLGFACKGPIETVYRFLEEADCLDLLKDPLIDIATQEVLGDKQNRHTVSMDIKRKEKAVNALKIKYRCAQLSSDDIHLCLYSICDNNSFLNSNRVPIDKVIAYLQQFFSPDKIEDGYALSIVSGVDGARLSHSHERQYYFALQSLTLWRDIVDDMFRLWHMAEEDLLSESVSYTLKNTGQGMQRVQQSPRTYRAMQQILARVQGKVKKWIGSSVIHMGDHNVPNSLSFIDKYTQVPRILGPIVSCLENLERICDEDDGIQEYVQSTYGGLDKLKKDILYDFFKSAFDGSGADNFYDAGSCIDGRLTSAWNWCSQLSLKRFYPIFRLTGFIGFDGEFK